MSTPLPSNPLSASQTSVKNRKFEKLKEDGSNYTVWKILAENSLFEEGLWVEKRESPKSGKEAWRSLAYMVDSNCLLSIAAEKCGESAWKTLEDLFQPEGINYIFDLQSQLFNLEMNEMPLKHFVVKIKTANAEIKKNGGTPFDDNILILILIRALPKKYAGFKILMDTYSKEQLSNFDFIAKKIINLNLENTEE